MRSALKTAANLLEVLVWIVGITTIQHTHPGVASTLGVVAVFNTARRIVKWLNEKN